MEQIIEKCSFLGSAEGVYVQPAKLDLYEKAIASGEAGIGSNGQLCIHTSPTGRSAGDKYLVKEDGLIENDSAAGKIISEFTFNEQKAMFVGYAKNRQLYVIDFIANDIKCRLITLSPTSCLFVSHMFKRVESLHENPDLTIVHFIELDVNNKPLISCNLKEGLVLIGGTGYLGEIKKSVFTYASYKYPLEEKFPMHASVTSFLDGTGTAIFFGLSGTGKTSLSADPTRCLLGDDEHVWCDDGVRNIESGCYAKAIRLSSVTEPQIWNAVHRFSTIVENAHVNNDRSINLNSSTRTENSRATYPLDFIENALPVGSVVNHPENIIMLTCDAYGALPAVSKLGIDDALHWFRTGYTAKVAGTEAGVNEPTPVFSPCFGAPFMPHVIDRYVDLFKQKLEKYKPNVWLVNTGWLGPFEKAQRIPIHKTRKIINMILEGKLNDPEIEWWYDKEFKLFQMLSANRKGAKDSNPWITWKDEYDMEHEEYMRVRQILLEKFSENLK